MGRNDASVHRSDDGREYKQEVVEGFLQPLSVRATNQAGDEGFKNVSGGEAGIEKAAEQARGMADAKTFDKKNG